jgi:hypothetical protein
LLTFSHSHGQPDFADNPIAASLFEPERGVEPRFHDRFRSGYLPEIDHFHILFFKGLLREAEDQILGVAFVERAAAAGG